MLSFDVQEAERPHEYIIARPQYGPSEMLKIAVEERESTLVGHGPSLSIFVRLTRPLLKLVQQGKAVVTVKSTDALFSDPDFNYDVVFLNRPSSRASLELINKAKAKQIPIIIDIDDWMFSLPRYGAGLYKQPDPSSIFHLYQSASVMTFPTLFFSQVMNPFVAARTVVLPYGFDFQEQASTTRDRTSYKTILITSLFTLKLSRGLSDFASALKKFLDERADWRIDFFCENLDKNQFSHPRIGLFAPVPFEDYLRLLRENDYAFSLVPLSGYESADDLLHNACKSPLKFIDYSANGISGIYSRTPVYETVVQHRQNGMLVDNTFEGWYAAISEMADDSVLRQRLANESHAFVRETFTIEHSVSALIAAIECAVD
jgi:glycosyltransferase involved in cell wall biosynthesis